MFVVGHWLTFEERPSSRFSQPICEAGISRFVRCTFVNSSLNIRSVLHRVCWATIEMKNNARQSFLHNTVHDIRYTYTYIELAQHPISSKNLGEYVEAWRRSVFLVNSKISWMCARELSLAKQYVFLSRRIAGSIESHVLSRLERFYRPNTWTMESKITKIRIEIG